MGQGIFISRSVDEVAEAYVAARVGTDNLVSTADAVRAIRQAVPECQHSDRELVDLVIALALSSRCNVAFDASTGRPGDQVQTPDVLGA